MTLNLKENNDILGPELDVREIPIAGQFQSFFVEDDTSQDIAVAAGWVDVTGMTKTFALEREKKVVEKMLNCTNGLTLLITNNI